ncbi:hypothetical protein [Pedobacter jeongneungensis]|uniref:hypothetical protein n=1 Tax=Pedobacter jeongneungensis TaxID=947309 RepID=UPI000468D741|nr:hypothetical protein [Pedobacter jeongneungensis]
MKNKINLRCLILPLLGVISIASCKKDGNIDNLNEKLVTNAVAIENGYLKFRDQKAFDSLLSVLVKPENIKSKPKELANFKSYKDIFLEIEKEYENVNTSKAFDDFKNKYSEIVAIKSDSSLTYKFGTPLSALFTNSKGEVKIGDFTTVYTKDNRIVSYKGKYKNESEVATISKTDKSQGIFVTSLSGGYITAKSNQMAGVEGTTTRVVRSRLYYNEDGKRRLFVDIWVDETPNQGPNDWTPRPPISRYYCSSRQELKKTFGGWRTNETDYYFDNLNYAWQIRGGMGDYRYFNLAYHSVQGVYGPVIIDMATISEEIMLLSGSGHFTSGGVPNTPIF